MHVRQVLGVSEREPLFNFLQKCLVLRLHCIAIAGTESQEKKQTYIERFIQI